VIFPKRDVVTTYNQSNAWNVFPPVTSADQNQNTLHIFLVACCVWLFSSQSTPKWKFLMRRVLTQDVPIEREVHIKLW